MRFDRKSRFYERSRFFFVLARNLDFGGICGFGGKSCLPEKLVLAILAGNLVLAKNLVLWFWQKNRFYGFEEKSRFYSFGKKSRFWWEIQLYDFGGNTQFYDFGGKSRFHSFGEKSHFLKF